MGLHRTFETQADRKRNFDSLFFPIGQRLLQSLVALQRAE